MKIIIIGAGIGGLTTAIALNKIGFETAIYEAAAELLPIGAGIILSLNALQVFDRIGMLDAFDDYGKEIRGMQLTDAQLNSIGTNVFPYFEEKYQLKNRSLHRGLLQKVLLEQYKGELFLGKKCISFAEKNAVVRVNFEDGSTAQGDVLIGTDGINSILRKSLFPKSKLRYANQNCWRGILDFKLPKAYQSSLFEAWGAGSRFGFTEIGNGQVYWYALLDGHENQQYEFPPKQLLQEEFKAYNSLVSKLISATKTIIRNDIYDLIPIKKWHQGRTLLIGDAAHAATPNLGQGACQAIEDAYCLSLAFKKHNALDKVFNFYEKKRRPKVKRIVKTSWEVGKLAHLKNPFLRWIRNSSMKQAPIFLLRKQFDDIFDVDYIVK